MKVLFVCDSLGSGGAQKLLVDFALSFDNSISCDFVILEKETDRYSSLLKEAGINVFFLSNKMKSHLFNIKKINEIVKKGEYDLVHVNLFPSTYYLSLLKMVKRDIFPPIVMTEHSTDNRRRHIILFKPIEKVVYSYYDHIVSISEQTQNNLLEWLGNTNINKYSVIENGVNLSHYSNAKPYLKSDLTDIVSDDDILIGMIGSFTPQKNHKNMVKAMSMLPNNYKLALVGEGPLRKEIEDYIVSENNNDRIAFLGYREDIPSIIKTLDIVVLPSLWEGFGLIAVETMAAGVPIAISNVSGLREVVGECALAFDPNKPSEIAHIIESALEIKGKERRIQQGIVIAQQFSIERMRDRYLELFKKIVDSDNKVNTNEA